MKTLLIFDSSPGRRDAHCAQLANAGHALFAYVDGQVSTFPQRQVSTARAFDLIFLHGNDQLAFTGFNCTGPIIYYGGEPGDKGANWIPTSVGPSSPLSEDALKRLVACFFNEAGQVVETAIGFVWPKTSQSILALRLLCEAWEFTGGEAERIDNVSAVVIHAPTCATEWFSPFGIIPPSLPYNDTLEEKRRFDNELSGFAQLMIGMETESKALADAIVKGTDLSAPISAVLKKSESAGLRGALPSA